jgi:HNH endonuclease
MKPSTEVENRAVRCESLRITRLEIARQQAIAKLLTMPHDLLFGERDICWLWPFERDAKDYGVIWAEPDERGRRFSFAVHRLSYEHYKGEIPAGQVIRHSCDRPPCFNPAHLLAGTQQENMADMVARGRHWRQK